MDTTFYHVSERTIERVAEVAASTVPGCRTIDAKLAGLAGRSFPRIDVRLDQASGTANIEAEIASSYPAPIAAITDAVRATIIAHVQTLTGIDVSRVKVTVANVESVGPSVRVTWDEVANHNAFVIPEGIRVSPTRVVQPVTKPREELTAINVHSLIDDMRAVVVPAPPEVESVETPAPVEAEGVDTPSPVTPVTPEVPRPRPLVPVRTFPTEARVPFPPAPVSPWTPSVNVPRVRTPQVPVAPALKPIVVDGPPRPEPVSLPLRAPLKEIRVNRPPQRPVEVRSDWSVRRVTPPPPTPVMIPRIPAPEPLKEIRIEPVVKYYDRSR